jgi:four helix bundle protein
MFGFEKLDVWHKAIEMSDHIYLLTRSFPADERFGLTSQMRRSAVSVASNIAEGGGRSSRNDFKRFIEIAYGSLMELVTQSTIARRQGFLSDADYDETYNLAQQIARMLSGLKSAIKPKE